MKIIFSEASQRATATAANQSFGAFQALFTLLVCFMLSVMAAPLASAHPPKEADTEITFNQNTGLVEIVHRYRIHDSEEVLHRLYEDQSLSIMTDSRAQALFGQYIESRFSIIRNGSPIPLNLVGGEIEDGFIWIYQTTDPLPADGLYVLRSNELMDTHQDQTNVVNVRLYDQTQTFIFTRSTPWATFRLDGSDVY